MTTTTSIGRNVGGEPMPLVDWERFCRQLRIEAEKRGLLFYGRGYGVWDGDSEESFTVVTRDELLVHVLTALAHHYGQEAIAVTTGESRFVRP